jgi:molybdopterin converting factor small subunit
VTVEVRLFANLADYGPPAPGGGALSVDVPEGTTVDELCRRLEIPDDQPRLALVNGRDAPPGQRLYAGDVIALIPPLAGGAQ